VTRPRHADPVDLLPAPMRAAARDRVGRVLVLLWLPVLAALVAVTRLGAPGRDRSAPLAITVDRSAPAGAAVDRGPGGGSSASPRVALEIEVGGAEPFRIGAPDASGARTFASGAASARIERRSEGLVARGAGGELLLSADRDGDEIRVLDANGALAFRMKRKGDDGYAIRGGGGELVCRVKAKPDKFNLYDAQGARIRRGKFKRGALVVRDGQDRVILTIAGARDLGRAGLLAAPVPELARALLWALTEGDEGAEQPPD
jgi:hypothetical protein